MSLNLKKTTKQTNREIFYFNFSFIENNNNLVKYSGVIVLLGSLVFEGVLVPDMKQHARTRCSRDRQEGVLPGPWTG